MTISMSTIAVWVIFPALSLAIGMAFYRLWRGPSLPDRVVALDLLTTLGIGVIAFVAIFTDKPAFLDVSTVMALTAFLGTVAFAYYVEQRSLPKDGN